AEQADSHAFVRRSRTDKNIGGEITAASRAWPVMTGSAGVGIWTCWSQHAGLRRRTRLPICRCAGPTVAVKPVEDRVEKFFPMFHCFLERKATAIDVGLVHVNGNRGAVSDLLSGKNCAGNKKGTEGK